MGIYLLGLGDIKEKNRGPDNPRLPHQAAWKELGRGCTGTTESLCIIARFSKMLVEHKQVLVYDLYPFVTVNPGE